MTITRNFSILAEGASSAGVLAVANGGSGYSTGVPVSTRQVLTSGTTYTTPANVRQLKIRMVGGGGGGAGTSSTGRPAGSSGGASSFNSITAVGGAGGYVAGGNNTTPGTGSASFRVPGAPGGGLIGNTNTGAPLTTLSVGGNGGQGPFGGGSIGGVATGAGGNAPANSGAGGGGAANGTGSIVGAGGQAGEYVELIINSPSATYTYAIGTSGAGGTGGTENGGNGGTGLIIVDEFY